MKNNSLVIANSLAVTTAVIYVVCAAAALLVPDLYLSVAQSWFHGMDLSKIAFVNITIGSFLTGLITITAAAWLLGYLFSYVHNLFARR